MTHTNTEALSDAKLNEMLEGLEGVTPGPWITSRRENRPIDGASYEIGAPDRGVAGMMHAKDAAHIARCDPDTIRYLVTQELSRRSASNTGGVEVKARQALAVYGKWVMDVATLGELADLEARMAAVGVTLQDVGEWSNPPSLAAEAEPVAQGSCASCNGTGDTGGNPSYGMCPDCDGTGKFPPAHPSSSVSAEVTVTAEDVLDQAVAFAEMWGTPDNWQQVRDAFASAIQRYRSARADEAYRTGWQDAFDKAAALRSFAKSFHVSVVEESVYKDVTLHLDAPHALSIRLRNNSDKSWIFADLEGRRIAALAALNGGRENG